MILSGGGGAAKNPAAYELFANSVDKRKPVLYICFASLPEAYAEAYGKFAASMVSLGIYSTRLCDSPEFFSKFELSEFGGIYCAGGNTFRLLKTLRDCGADKKIKDYLHAGGVWIGSSAGAIIGGADIQPIIFMDANAVLLEDTRGLDMMNGFSTIAHYGNAASEQRNSEWYAAVDLLAKKYNKLVALSEEAAIVIEENKTYILGVPCRVYENGVAREIPDGGLLY
jgi:dipeptidase E